MNRARRTATFLGIVALSSAAYGTLLLIHLRYGTLRADATIQTLIAFGVAYVAYLSALLWAEGGPHIPWLWIWMPALLFRLVLWFTTPSLSDDVYRYLWDGYVANHGVSPYAFAIDSDQLDYLAIPIRSLANQRWMASPYLPVAQWLFAGLTRLFPLQPVVFQVAMSIFDLVAALFLVRMLDMARLPTHRILIYLWNPLVIVEIAHGAHVDAWMICLTVVGVWLFLGADSGHRSRLGPTRWRTTQCLAAVALALATLTKVLPLLLVPVLFWRWRWQPLVVYGLVTAGILLPYGLNSGWGLIGPTPGVGLFGALRIYADQWNFNSGLFHWLEVALATAGIAQANRWAKAASGMVMASILLLVWLQARRVADPRELLRLAAIPFMAYLMLTATVHPWYLISLLIFVPMLAPGREESAWRWIAALPWIYLSGAIFASYVTYLDPANLREYEAARVVQWLPVLILLPMAAWIQLMAGPGWTSGPSD